MEITDGVCIQNVRNLRILFVCFRAEKRMRFTYVKNV